MNIKSLPDKSDSGLELRHQTDLWDEGEIPLNVGAVDFRHLSAFKRVYLERNYANAGISLSTTRKSIRRMMQNLERVFECNLFTEGEKGDLHSTPFSERLFNDLRFLHAAQCRLKDHINTIHENGRILHISSSPAVFRTPTFRSLFKELQSINGVRLSYTAVGSDDAGKALLSGQCDLYIGSWTGQAKRFITVGAGRVRFRLYHRKNSIMERRTHPTEQQSAYYVQLDGCGPDTKYLPNCGRTWQPLTEKQWMRWLSNPEDCAAGTVICAPDVPVDENRWTSLELDAPPSAVNLGLHASFLRQHPYEFLPALAGKIRHHAALS